MIHGVSITYLTDKLGNPVENKHEKHLSKEGMNEFVERMHLLHITNVYKPNNVVIFTHDRWTVRQEIDGPVWTRSPFTTKYNRGSENASTL